jgi:hypothetical protein
MSERIFYHLNELRKEAEELEAKEALIAKVKKSRSLLGPGFLTQSILMAFPSKKFFCF